MTAALLLLAAGVGSLVPSVPGLRRRRSRVLAWAAWALAAAALGAWGLGMAPLASAAAVAVSALWWALSVCAPPSAPARLIAGDALLAVAVAAALVWPLPTGAGTLAGPSLLVAVPGVLILLGPAANRLVGAVLASVRVGPAPARTGERPERRISRLRGGRVIGPLERLLIVGLALSGAETAIAAVVAAKGIVRFPEISRDNAGDAAEEFLIGSMTSWLVAGLAAAALHGLQNY
ncbi:MAG: beta-carotene 15,15'-monooxygenase [Actinomyces sp.]|jgi:hypothetical protein|nr:beta-carotene 15,15'-monooxygenase [Actinomyces sp.]MCI1661367.1 beta-carotene 15,15'-monooxygenase [Actinomyces sp.]